MENTPIKILLADDDEGDRLLFIEAFNELEINTEIATVKNGTDLMDYLTRTDSILPDLLFLDLNMPRKNGIECLKEIKSNKNLLDISIAIYSTSSSEKDVEETFFSGANIYIQKPNDFIMLKQVLEKAVMVAYEYQDPSFNRENFLLRI